MRSVTKQIINHLTPMLILFLSVYSVIEYSNPGVRILHLINNTTFWWAISFFILIIYFYDRIFFFDNRNKKNTNVIWIYLLWNTICIIRGMFVAETYWDWKGLISNAMALLLPIIIFASTNRILVQSVLAYYVKYALLLFPIFAILVRPDAYGFYLIPLSFLLLFTPALTMRQRIVLLVATLIIFFADLGARSTVIKFVTPFLLLPIYYWKNFFTEKKLEIARLTLIALPIVLFTLGATDVFNVFKMDEYLKGDFTTMGTDEDGKRVEIDMTTDTRTFIYEEVVESAKYNDYWLLGRTPARGNDSAFFGDWNFETTGRYERLSNEIGVANVFTWTGIVGVFLYLLIFYKASFLAINKSNNVFVKMLGIYVAFRWLYSWIEDLNNFSLNYFMLMVMLGLCFSESFRKMNDEEMVIWVRGIFNPKYVQYQRFLFRKNKNKQ